MNTTADVLTECIHALPDSWRRALSWIILESDDGVSWEARCSYALWTDGPGRRDVGPYTVTVDTRELPPGVSVTVSERVPDSRHALGRLSREQITAAITALAASGLVGGLDWSRAASGRWHIAFHAGSDAERRAWVRAQRPEKETPR